jgi:hypothetical protein
MSAMSNLFTLIAVAGVVVVGFAVLKGKVAAQQSGGEDKFKVKPLLTQNELEFLERLESAIPEYRFLAQVSMGALLDPAVSRKDAKAYYRLRGMFTQKIVDFVAQNRKDGTVVAIIELDDRTHNGDRDAKRDSMLASAGYKIVRWNSKTKPDSAAIRGQLVQVMPDISMIPTIPAKLMPG